MQDKNFYSIVADFVCSYNKFLGAVLIEGMLKEKWHISLIFFHKGQDSMLMKWQRKLRRASLGEYKNITKMSKIINV